ncbi:uncharacterized protein LOC127587045 [Pristis pectinata]|uniref:uncharacterized protein LOC127587045 n=1 Tax=Pristis pectinata TaxID=685728 RepID=UPI00223D2A4D|nr:uncharacterized protein LOC127587045 [Pristis pectinata]XP_051901154.1 uncharacterized protein LOC127587045 [Pristis pectinata]
MSNAGGILAQEAHIDTQSRARREGEDQTFRQILPHGYQHPGPAGRHRASALGLPAARRPEPGAPPRPGGASGQVPNLGPIFPLFQPAGAGLLGNLFPPPPQPQPKAAEPPAPFSTIDATELFGSSFQASSEAVGLDRPELYLGEPGVEQLLPGQDGECVSLGSIDNVDFRELLRAELPRQPDFGLASPPQQPTLMSYSPDLLKLMVSSQEPRVGGGGGPGPGVEAVALNGELEAAAADFLPDEDDPLMSLFSQSFELMNSSEINKIYEAQRE